MNCSDKVHLICNRIRDKGLIITATSNDEVGKLAIPCPRGGWVRTVCIEEDGAQWWPVVGRSL